MKPCEEYEVWISAFLDGELSGEDRSELMQHMAVCQTCQRYFDDLVAVHDALEQEEVPVPEGFGPQLMARVRETEQEKPRKRIPFPHWRQWTALAACCALAVLGLWSFRNAQGNQKAAQDAVAACVPYAAPDGADIPEALNGSEAGTVPEESPKLRMANDDTPPQPEPQEAKLEDEALSIAPAAAPPAGDAEMCMERDNGPTVYENDETGALSQGTLSAGGEAARRWVEDELGLDWESGRLYQLTEEEYAGLLAALTEVEEDFRQESGEGFWLLAE